MKKYTWSASANDELWQHDDFDTIEECVLDAKENYGYEAGTDIAIGEAIPFIVSVDADDIIERLEENAYEECGEASEGWIHYKQEQLDELSEILTKHVNEWLEKTKNKPTFYKIDNIISVTIN